MSFASKTGATRGRGRTHRRRARLLPLLPRRHVVVFFLLADKPRRPSSLTPVLRPVATEVRTSFPCPLWTPRPSSRGERDARTAPLRRRVAAAGDAVHGARLGCFSCRCRRLHQHARTVCRPILVSLRCRSTTAALTHCHGPDAGAFAFSHVPELERRLCAVVHPSTHPRYPKKARLGLWPFPFPCAGPHRDVAPVCSLRRQGPRRGGLPHARGRRGGEHCLCGRVVHASPPVFSHKCLRPCPAAGPCSPPPLALTRAPFRPRRP
jgi:hypothetical protein